MTRSEFGAGFSYGRAMRGGVAVSVMVRGFMRSANETQRRDARIRSDNTYAFSLVSSPDVVCPKRPDVFCQQIQVSLAWSE
jgi:hypothetical protein